MKELDVGAELEEGARIYEMDFRSREQRREDGFLTFCRQMKIVALTGLIVAVSALSWFGYWQIEGARVAHVAARTADLQRKLDRMRQCGAAIWEEAWDNDGHLTTLEVSFRDGPEPKDHTQEITRLLHSIRTLERPKLRLLRNRYEPRIIHADYKP